MIGGWNLLGINFFINKRTIHLQLCFHLRYLNTFSSFQNIILKLILEICHQWKMCSLFFLFSLHGSAGHAPHSSCWTQAERSHHLECCHSPCQKKETCTRSFKYVSLLLTTQQLEPVPWLQQPKMGPEGQPYCVLGKGAPERVGKLHWY